MSLQSGWCSKRSPPPDAGDAVRYRDTRQAAAVTEGIIPDAGDTIRNRDARKAAAKTEGFIPNAGNTVRDPDTLQVATF